MAWIDESSLAARKGQLPKDRIVQSDVLFGHQVVTERKESWLDWSGAQFIVTVFDSDGAMLVQAKTGNLGAARALHEKWLTLIKRKKGAVTEWPR